MAGVDWRIQGLDITTCSCDWGCPCQFIALPTKGFCHAAVGFYVAKGHYGKISLDGLSFGGLFAWPEAIHQGNGEAQPIVDARADEAQRDAILKIMSGEDTEPGATVFNVFAATYTKVHSPLFKPITVEADMSARTGRFFVDGVVDARIAHPQPRDGQALLRPHRPAGRFRVRGGRNRQQQRAHDDRADQARVGGAARSYRAARHDRQGAGARPRCLT